MLYFFFVFLAPLKGIPSRVLTPGFRSSALASPSMGGRPQLSRTPAGRKDGGIKLLDIAEQPLGYAAAKKRRKLQEVEEAKKTSETQPAVLLSPTATSPPNATPDYAAGLTATPTYAPSTPQPRETGKNLRVLVLRAFLILMDLKVLHRCRRHQIWLEQV